MKGLFIFAAGLAIGAVAGACMIKNKVLADAKEEINEVREYYRNKKEEVKEETPVTVVEKKEVEKIETTPVDKKEYGDLLQRNGYTNYNKVETPKVAEIKYEPYIIDPSEFGEEPGYDTVTATYFADKVLVDDVDEVIEDQENTVGLKNLSIFEEFGATSIYVRNDFLRIDYEILRDDWWYTDIQEPPKPVEKKPHQL